MRFPRLAPAARPAIAALAALVLFSGCLSSGDGAAKDPAVAAGDEATDAQAAGASGPWDAAWTAKPWFSQAEGQPFHDVTVFEGCDSYDFEVPAGTARLEMHLFGSASSPGTGYMTFMARHEGDAWITPSPVAPFGSIYLEPPSESTTIAVEAPAAGTWEVSIWPHGPVADQTWDMEAHAHGEGAAPPAAGGEMAESCGSDR